MRNQSWFQPGNGLRDGRCQRAKWEGPYNLAESRGKVQRQKGWWFPNVGERWWGKGEGHRNLDYREGIEVGIQNNYGALRDLAERNEEGRGHIFQEMSQENLAQNMKSGGFS